MVVLVAIAGYAAWFYYYKSDDKKKKSADSYAACVNAGNPVQQTYPPVCVTKDGKRFTDSHANTNQPSLTAPNVPTDYLQLKEWGLRVPLTNALNDLTYTYVKNDTYESMFFTFKRLQSANICKTDVGLAMSRTKTENKAPYDLENPAVFAHVGEYYYYLAYGGAYCYDADNEQEVILVKTVEPNGDLIKAVKSQLQNLETAQ